MILGQRGKEIEKRNGMSWNNFKSLWFILLRRADHSRRGVLPTVVRRCVWSRNLKNEEVMTRVGSQRHKKKRVYTGRQIPKIRD